MITIRDYHVRQNKEGKPFISLELEGDLEMVQSQATGRFYATARKCSITSSFNEDTAKTLIGKTLPGKIVRKQCEAYEFSIPETGERIQLAHRYEYQPEEINAKAQEQITVSLPR